MPWSPHFRPSLFTQIFLSVWSEQLKADTQILAPSLGYRAPWASDFSHLCTSFFVCCKNGLYKEVFTSKVLYLAVSVQTSLALPWSMNGPAAMLLGELQLWGCFPVVLFVAQELPSYCQRTYLSCCYWGLQLLGCQLCITNMLSAAICTYSRQAETRGAWDLPGVMQLSPSLLCPHSLALCSWPDQTANVCHYKTLVLCRESFSLPSPNSLPF